MSDAAARTAPAPLRVGPALDVETAPDLRNVIAGRFDGSSADVALDLAEVRHIDIAGLAVLADVVLQCRERGGKATLIGEPAPPVERLLSLSGFDRFFEKAVAA